ncbi:sodium:alanine symporter family protein [Candidatus Palauibacter polyketidifaciens]|uniref:alanine/glycine:cation symporter family protein n=1 Tax=Candidatus Palauibacter polyketidifaciens TaxID=3056740 RepID=UPI0023A58BE4|nr:sodium:alanine symporter family protein [Candidatus Palauibacter polyketidifaciens]MDE2719949.1 sodium:alanine symporter family protein [Candidatus Palauibacter polyketidifaciens]
MSNVTVRSPQPSGALSPGDFQHEVTAITAADAGSPHGLLEAIQAWVWGVPLIILLLTTGLVYTLLLRGLQFRRLGHALWLALVKRREPEGEGDISHFQALMTALAATVGTGNIVGVATAIGAGGPGALFWMWVTGLLGMATKYAEAVLGVRFRETDARGEKAGGPMYYLEHGLGRSPVGRGLAIAFALFATFAAFGIGNGVQSQAVADAMNESFHVPHWIMGLVTAGAVGLVIIGGIRSIGRVASVIVPAMIVLYMGVAGVVLISNAAEIPAAFRLVFEHAFGGQAVAGGALGYTVLQAMRFGVARGIFSNESGLGTGAIAAAAAQTREPVRQALVSMTQTFIDTIVVCTLTGLAILTTGAWESGAEGANMTQLAFDTSLLAGAGDIVVALGLATFAFSTMLGWSYYGERSFAYLFGERVIRPYRLVFVIVIGLAAVVELDVVWLISDILNGLMAAPNLVGLLLLSGVVWRETRSYFNR